MLELENILTIRRIQREALENINKFYLRFNYLTQRASHSEILRFCQQGIILNKKRLKAVERELRRREYIRHNSFARLGY
jgi:hypothetical protein